MSAAFRHVGYIIYWVFEFEVSLLNEEEKIDNFDEVRWLRWQSRMLRTEKSWVQSLADAKK